MKKELLIIYDERDQALAQRLKNALSGSHEVGLCTLSDNPVATPPTLLILLTEHLLEQDLFSYPLLDNFLSSGSIPCYPVIARPCEWETSPFFGLNVLPQERIPLDQPRYWSWEEAVHSLHQSLDAPDQRLPTHHVSHINIIKIGWKVLPYQWKWGIRIGLIGFIALILILWAC